MTFRVPTCVCGHVSGSHARTSVSLNPANPASVRGGVCFLCGCDGFRDDRHHEAQQQQLVRRCPGCGADGGGHIGRCYMVEGDRL